MFGFGARKQEQQQQRQPRFAVPAYPRGEGRRHTAAHEPVDYVTLDDGTTVAVPRANLAAAKALLAARKAAERRVAAARVNERRPVAIVTEPPVLEREELLAS